MIRLFDVLTLLLILTTLTNHIKCNVESFTAEELISSYGYPLEKYKIHTQDGYTIGLERIPHSRNGGKTSGKPVLLMHGLFLSSQTFVTSKSSLGYSLSDAGYDVWLFNARGVGLSRTYSTYSKLAAPPRMNKMSWDFSFNEMGVYDFPAAVDFVLNKTGQPSVDVVGYSLGGTTALVGLSEKPAYNHKVHKLVLMAPMARMASYGFPFNMLNSYKFFYQLPVKYIMKNQSFFPMTQDPEATHRFIKWMCSYRIFYPFCLTYINLFQGTTILYNKDMVLKTLTDFPQPMSKKLLTHWIQLMSSKKFSKYDYGSNGNFRYYSMRTPPEYNLSKVTTPTFIIHSKNDHLAAPGDILWLKSKMSNLKDVLYINKVSFGHLSFVMHANIEQMVNSKIKNALATSRFN